MAGTTYTWVGGADIDGRNNWTTAANWVVNGLQVPFFPQSATDTAIVNVDDGSKDAIISGGQTITVSTIVIGGTATGALQGGHVVVGGSSAIGGGGGGTLNVTAAIGITSTNTGGALVGGIDGVINASFITVVGGGAVLGGGGTFNIPMINNDGVIQADGGRFGLGQLTLNANTISGTGFLEVDGPSALSINAATAQQVRVDTQVGETAVVVFDKPSQFTGSLNLLRPESHVNLFFAGETPTTVGFNADNHTLVISGANGTVLNSIPFLSNGEVPLAVVPSTVPGFGEIAIGGGLLGGIPAPVNGVSDTTLSCTHLGALLQGDQSAMRFIGGTEQVLLADGTLSVGADTSEAYLVRLYAGLLGREPDPTGLEIFKSAIAAGVPRSAVADTILGSAEYAVGHPATDNTGFIQTVYTNMLGRPIDDPGLNVWNQAFAAGATRGEVVAAIADSAEAKQYWAALTARGWFARDPNAPIVREIYLAGLSREADTPSLAGFTSALKSGRPVGVLVNTIVGSAEFQALHGAQENATYVNSIYEAGFGASADPGGLAAWTSALQGGSVSRADVLLAVATSPAGQAHVPWALS